MTFQLVLKLLDIIILRVDSTVCWYLILTFNEATNA
jgi:hypothetical protein